jgi:CRP/FNR family transcriptional regulator, cyclic AMP receptor protein
MPKAKAKFDSKVFLTTLDGDRTVSHYGKDEVVFEQGRPADAVFYIRSGKVKIVVTSEQGKEAVVAILETGDFFGEGSGSRCAYRRPGPSRTARSCGSRKQP